MLADAQRLRDIGYSLVPGSLDKKPLLPWGQWRDRRQEPGEVGEWDPPLWAIITGQAHGLVVLDFDGAAGVALAKSLGLTPNVVTGSGGWHVWIAASSTPYPVKTCAGVRPGLDVRGEGGLAWTVGRSRRGEYRLVSTEYITLDRDGAPPLINLLPERTAPVGTADFGEWTGDEDGTPAALRVTKAAAGRVAAARPGTRNAALNREAFNLGGLVGSGELSGEAATRALLRAAQQSNTDGLWPEDEMARTIDSALGSGSQTPWSTAIVDDDGEEYVSVSDLRPATPTKVPAPKLSLPSGLSWLEDRLVLPLDAFPPQVKALVEEASPIVNCPPEFIAMATIPALAAAAGGLVTMNLRDTWRWSPAFYVALVGPPSASKTPALNLALQPIRDAEAAEWVSTDDGAPETRYLVDDVTQEKLAELLNKNGRGLLMAVDELKGFFGGMGQYKGDSGGGRDRQFFLSAWSHEAITVDRIRRGSMYVARPTLSIVGGIQPEVFDQLTNAAEDGMMPRFLMAYGDPVPDVWRDEDILPAATLGYSRLWNDVRDQFMQEAVVNVTPEGRRAWAAWYNWFHAQEPPPMLAVSWNKVRGHMYRLTLLLACCDDGVVRAEHVDRAWTIIKALMSHTMHILKTAAAQSPDERKWVKTRERLAEFLDAIQAETGEMPSRSHVLRYGPPGARRARDLDALLGELGVIL